MLDRFIDIARGAQHVLTLRLPFRPVAGTRPRVTRWGTYYGKPYTKWRDAVRPYLQDHKLNLGGPLLVCVESVFKLPKRLTREFPKPDVDNLAKGPLDSITKAEGIWNDDDQIIWLMTAKRYGEPGEESHSLIEIYSP